MISKYYIFFFYYYYISYHISNSFFSQDRVDEFDYKKPLEGQTPVPIEKHWRKHTLACINPDSGEVSDI